MLLKLNLNPSPQLIFLKCQHSLTPRYPFHSSRNFSLISPLHRQFLPISDSSTQNVICRARKKKAMNTDDLRNGLLEFISELGLPHDHVPTFKELSHHGRYDLANVVKTRGYKYISELLTTTTNTNIKSTEENLTDKITDEQVLETNQQDEKTEFVDEDLNSDEKSSISLEPLTKKEKLALPTLQSKAESETRNVQKCISRKRGAKRLATEDSFSELVESALLESHWER